MTIKEINELRAQEGNKTLRNPKNMLVNDDCDIQSIYQLAWAITYLTNKNVLIRTGEDFNEEYDMTASNILKTSPFVKSLTGKGTKKNPYLISTTFGDGEFFDASAIIKLKKLKEIQKGYCFLNSYNFTIALAESKSECKCEQVSGIAFITKPFLHSVVVLKMDKKKYVLDLNYDLIMDYNFYVKLFSFEVLARNKGKVMHDDAVEIIEKCDGYTASDSELAFAYEEKINQIKQELGIFDGDTPRT